MMLGIPEDTCKILRKIIPYGYDYSPKKFEFRDERLGETYAIFVSRHPRGGVLLRSTHKHGNDAAHSFFGIRISSHASMALSSFSLAHENDRGAALGIKSVFWSTSTESGYPHFPDFWAAPIEKWKIDRVSNRDRFIGGLERLSMLAKELDVFIDNDRAR